MNPSSLQTPRSPQRARFSLRMALAAFVVGVATVVATGTGVTSVGAAVLQPPTSDPGASTTTTETTTTTTTTAPTTTTTTTAPPPPTTRPPAPPAPPTTAPPAPRPPAGPPPAPRARGWSVLVSLGRQHTYVYLNGALVKDIPVSSGAGGRTPRGTFRIYSKSAATTASSDPSVSMRFMTRFNGGIGFHSIPRKRGRALSTPLGIRPVSHGCIRMADLNAAWLYGNVPVGTTVVVK